MHNLPACERCGSNSYEGSMEPRPIICPFSVVETENVCGGSPRIRGSRIPLWGLEKARLNGFTDEEIIEMYPHLEIADLEDAWEYIAANKEEIEKALIENS